MKKTIAAICCAAGSFLIGFFANQLNTPLGAICFTLGVSMLTASVILLSKPEGRK